MLTLIKSQALYNAGIALKLDNINDIYEDLQSLFSQLSKEKDLHLLCSQLLNEADATKKMRI